MIRVALQRVGDVRIAHQEKTLSEPMSDITASDLPPSHPCRRDEQGVPKLPLWPDV
jgi:hypothetical protein